MSEGMAITSWGSLGGGNYKTEEDRRLNEGRKSEISDVDIKTSQALEKIAHRKSTAITSIALAYVMHKIPYVFPVIGGRKVEHLKGNIEALTIELTDEEVEEIESAVPFDLGFPHNFLWGKQVPNPLQDVWLLSTAGVFDHVQDAKVCICPSTLNRYYKSVFQQYHSPSSRRKAECRTLRSKRIVGAGYRTGVIIMMNMKSQECSHDGTNHGLAFTHTRLGVGIGVAADHLVQRIVQWQTCTL
jgi:hypothetical protein